jgi:predicted Zn-dependent protease
MTSDDLRAALERRAPGQWELYRKSAESRTLEASRTLRRTAWRREEGWAARWWESGAPRFAAASRPEALGRALPAAARLPIAAEPPPEWPSHASPAPPAEPVAAPDDLFEDLSRAVAAASRGEGILVSLSHRRGCVTERIVNAAGLDVAMRRIVGDAVAETIGRRGSRAREVRLAVRFEGPPDLEGLARRLADAATLPLSDRPTPFSSGQWLLDPAVAAAVLSALSPLFRADHRPAWAGRDRSTAPEVSISDDATTEAPFDGEGTPSRRVPLVASGAVLGRLDDLRSARRGGRRSTGHGSRPSFRTPPQLSPRRLFFETAHPKPRAELLAAVQRGLFASALTAPVLLDLERDRYEVEFTGISIVGGRAQGPVAGARAAGRVSELLRRIAGVATDLDFWPMPHPVGSPTLLVERASFD